GFLGVGTAATNNPYGGKGFSGLKFRDLTSNSKPCNTNPGLGILALDQYGNVIYVPAPPAPGNGISTCHNPIPLTDNGDVNMQKFNYYFDNSGSPVAGQNDVVIGEACNYPPGAKLTVDNYIETVGLSVNTSINTPASLWGAVISAGGSTNTNTALFANAPAVAAINIGVNGNGSAGTNQNYGGIFNAIGPSGSFNRGAVCSGTNGYISYGVLGGAAGATQTNCGVYAQGYQGVVSYGVYAYAAGGTTANYGVFGYSPCVGGTCFAGYFQGDVHVNGVNSGNGYLTVSDSIFKTNVTGISNPLAAIGALKPKAFYYDTNNIYKFNFSSAKHYGFLAQDVKRALPELVQTVTAPTQYDTIGHITSEGVTYSAIDYSEFAAILTGAVQQQEKSIDSLRHGGSGGGKDSSTAGYVVQKNASGYFGNSPMTVANGNVGIGMAPDGQLSVKNTFYLGGNIFDVYGYDGNQLFNINDNSGTHSASFLKTNLGINNNAPLYTLDITTQHTGLYGLDGIIIRSGGTSNVASFIGEGGIYGGGNILLNDAAGNNSINLVGRGGSDGSSFFTEGYVGFGTKAPNAQLTIQGETNYGDDFNMRNNAGTEWVNVTDAGAFNIYSQVNDLTHGLFLLDAAGNARQRFWNTGGDNSVFDMYNSANVLTSEIYAGGPSFFNGGPVGMGTNNPNTNAALDAENTGTGTSNIAVYANATGSGTTNYGIYASASNGATNYAG
ncbi:MAG TPA: tail fiber domain-containing protein, partial [Bacteroidia bacterium]|nr:tail fiber domain-containing protein [Bacteroidia bacterium]